jgi:hypothetical protein
VGLHGEILGIVVVVGWRFSGEDVRSSFRGMIVREKIIEENANGKVRMRVTMYGECISVVKGRGQRGGCMMMKNNVFCSDNKDCLTHSIQYSIVIHC